MKSISTVKLTITENMECTIVKVHAPLLALHLPKSCNKAITCVPQIVTYVVREKGMEYKGEQR